MSCETRIDAITREEYLAVDVRGRALLADPLTNKGTAFPPVERARLGLEGLVPPAVSTMTQQLERVYENFKAKESDLEQYIYLTSAEELTAVRTLQLSDSSELLLRLHWMAILSGRVQASLAVSGGVHTALDVVKATMAGADVTQMVSALLLHGPGYLRTVLNDLSAWLEKHEWNSLGEMRGNMNSRCPTLKPTSGQITCSCCRVGGADGGAARNAFVRPALVNGLTLAHLPGSDPTRASRTPIATSNPFRIAWGRGGHPGMYTSTGKTRSTPPIAA